MRKVREILRLRHDCVRPLREIAVSCAVGPASVRQALARPFQETFEIGISMWEHVDDLSSGQSGQVVLHSANLVEQPQGVERREHCAQAVPNGVRDGLRRKQSRARCRWCMIPLSDSAPSLVLRPV